MFARRRARGDETHTHLHHHDDLAPSRAGTGRVVTIWFGKSDDLRLPLSIDPVVDGRMCASGQVVRANMLLPTGVLASGQNSLEEHWINVVKHLSVSTGQLNTLPCLHTRPINLVVFQGTLSAIGGHET